MKYIYLLLTRPNSVPSRLIAMFTSDPFTHVSIAFDENITVMYSFTRIYRYFPVPGGLVEEKITKGFYSSRGNTPCTLLRLSVSDEIFYKARKKVLDMLARRSEYSYNYLGLFLCKLGIPRVRHNKFFCSEFVGRVLEDSGALELTKPSSLIRPNDFRDMHNFEIIYIGALKTLQDKIKPELSLLND